MKIYPVWYERNIEPEIRDLVFLLRNNGFNTTYSCGHALVVEIDSSEDSDVTRAYDLLIENGYLNFVIELRVFQNGSLGITRCLSILLKKEDGSFGRP